MRFFTETRRLFLPIKAQLRKWRRASRKMKWDIDFSSSGHWGNRTFDLNGGKDYVCGPVLSYGFGDDGAGCADAVLSGRYAWHYAVRRWKRRTWQCQYIDFGRPDHIRLYPKAPKRPKGFYLCMVCIPKQVQRSTVAQFRRAKSLRTGLGPEGLQMLIITHPHLQAELNQRRLPCLSFADYDVAPHGFYDFYDAVQMFCSNNTLGLGIGNVDRDYPLFAIPYMHFVE